MQGYQLTFFTTHDRRHGGLPLGEWLLQEARKLGVAGATLLAASEGFGHDRKLHSAHFIELADQPVEVTMALGEADAERFFPAAARRASQVFYVKVPIEFGVDGGLSARATAPRAPGACRVRCAASRGGATARRHPSIRFKMPRPSRTRHAAVQRLVGDADLARNRLQPGTHPVAAVAAFGVEQVQQPRFDGLQAQALALQPQPPDFAVEHSDPAHRERRIVISAWPSSRNGIRLISASVATRASQW